MLTAIVFKTCLLASNTCVVTITNTFTPLTESSMAIADQNCDQFIADNPVDSGMARGEGYSIELSCKHQPDESVAAPNVEMWVMGCLPGNASCSTKTVATFNQDTDTEMCDAQKGLAQPFIQDFANRGYTVTDVRCTLNI